MIKRTLFQCQYCWTDYADEAKCQACEDGHKKKLKINANGCKYHPITMLADGFPVIIKVVAEDGSEALYKR